MQGTKGGKQSPSKVYKGRDGLSHDFSGKKRYNTAANAMVNRTQQ